MLRYFERKFTLLRVMCSFPFAVFPLSLSLTHTRTSTVTHLYSVDLTSLIIAFAVNIDQGEGKETSYLLSSAHVKNASVVFSICFEGGSHYYTRDAYLTQLCILFAYSYHGIRNILFSEKPGTYIRVSRNSFLVTSIVLAYTANEKRKYF